MLDTLGKMAEGVEIGQHEIKRVLGYARRHLDMDVAWVSRCNGGEQVIELLDGDSEQFGLRVGDPVPYAVGGPTRAHAHSMAPLRHSDGRLYGLLGCLSANPRPTMRARDDEFLQLAATLLAPSLDSHQRRREQETDIRARIQAVLDAGGPDIVYQPIQVLADQRTIAFEAFSRFPVGLGPETPNLWFAEAAGVGLDTELEIAAIRRALRGLDHLEPHIRLSLNTSAATLQQPALVDVLEQHDLRRLIVEITEHDQISDYDRLRDICDALRRAGAQIAIDDTGAGYAGLRHLIEIRPDIIKLDRDLVSGIDSDPSRAAMATCLLSFGDAIGATVLAEGVETSAELSTVARLGIPLGQGYLLGLPQPLTRASVDLETTRHERMRSAPV